MQGFAEFTEEKKIIVKTKMGGEIPATIKVTGKDYHIVKTDSGKQYKVDHQGNSLEEEIELSEEQLDELSPTTLKSYLKKTKNDSTKYDIKGNDAAMKGDVDRANKMWGKGDNRYHGRNLAADKLTREGTDDKDLPFTPDKKPAKPSTAGKYGSAYSTVRNLARRALEKQAKLKKEEVDLEEEQIDERNKENALKRKTMDAARGAMYKIKTGLKVDPESTGHKTPQEFNKALGRAIRNEEIEQELDESIKKMSTSDLQKHWDTHKDEKGASPVFAAHLKRVAAELKARKSVKKEEVEQIDEVNVKQIKKDLDSGLSYDAVIGKHSNKKLTNTNEIRKIIQQHAWDKRMKKEEVDLEENAPVAPSIGVHRIGVTVSDPGHTSVSKRNEKLQKFVRVTAKSKEHALEQGKKFYAKKGFKVHDAEHAGMVHEEVEMDEGWYQKASPSYARTRHGQDLNKKAEDEHYDKQTPKMQDAINRHLRTGKSYKDAVTAASKHVKEETVSEGYRGNSEADKPYFDAQDHKTAAEKAHKEGDRFAYHMHMAAHHDSMAHWSSNKGRHHVADLHMSKAENHEHYAQQARKGSK